MKTKTIRLILGDQLNYQHSWYQNIDDSILYVITELKQETDYTKHHIQKVCAFFSAMESFSTWLAESGHQVKFLTLDYTAAFADLPDLLTNLCLQTGASQLQYQSPDEYRLSQQLSELDIEGVSITCVDTEHFMLSAELIPDQFPKGKHVLMEHFYRRMRKQFGILMDANDKPVGGKWNYDANNRKKLKPADIDQLPEPLMFANDITTILERIERHGVVTMGNIGEQLLWPVNRSQALNLLAHFCQICLPLFGTFQDAMTSQHKAKWSLYHSRLSFAINAKILSPLEVIDAALTRYEQPNSNVSLDQIEGFVRQIIGWREYIRGVYWANMPEYAEKNHLNATRTLPDYFWTGKTRMHCMKQAIDQSLDYAYAHHIQRLMVTGNFALVTGCHPDEVDDWYLGIYVDAIEWVEMPNTRGMALFADGGVIATKPYAASGSYINKMSDYCKGCHYDVKQRSGESACPFNGFYWRFMNQHRELLSKNPRIGMIYRSWDNMDLEVQDAILDTAEKNLQRIEEL
ncbi:putative deoxyribodipyrimidine photolyase related protein [Vibrio nigripulchritudo MADA3029]|uniref:cryptochrome/photolyase family protein n=1 Tax=Vibrio nigripulchritudo TaxID=28173 RepID=UPI0003B1FC57|nr:cryptochrome/photolyase family protein [Vibrio nigripulchritudo]CCN46696.1 putative deoxyribodipyrimidine photolyase related protein [Vibrio nigripulchritudo MADA3020]CCN54527.1 putative deoxyribodipyrimidine photolyase related protein [Vibrio nigripulchritudo MADA3021]CCN59555.1 putative deoxyribodipyrimidine photolyase related protein [Vibrio nigripulchritudo MADA3029]